VAVPNRGQRLDAEEEAIEKPMCCSEPGDAIAAEAVQNSKGKIQRNVNNRDKQRELRPAQAEKPAVNIAPLVFAGVDLDELDRARLD